ncbi:hypothetical protein OLK001_14440 [Synechocystis sp. LKSZ1]
MTKRAVVLLSGGLDSATSAAIARQQGYELIALSFNYGQRHQRELQAALALAQHLQITQHYTINLDLAQWGGSSLTDTSQAIPTSGVDTSVIPSTYVPGRNTIFIALGLSLAEAQGAEAIFLGINAIDYSGYPDCRPDYLQAYQHLAALSSKVGIEGHPIQLIAPLIQDSKVDIIQKAVALGVPIAQTWSCYQGDLQPCGRCDACRIRDQALIEVGYPELASSNLPRLFFDFEAEFVDSLRCIPMVVRYKLDTCGVKLKLQHWHGFSQDQRQQLVTAPCGTALEVEQYRQQLQAWVAAQTGTPANTLSIDPAPPWLETEQIPATVLQHMQERQLPLLSTTAWADLSPLQRFALIKLSQPGHENRNFLPALQEFGLAGLEV